MAAASLSARGFLVNAYSLCAEPYPDAPPGVELWSARNSRYRFATRVASEALKISPAHSLILAMHVHLAVTALPLVTRGIEMSVFLHGIEAWKPLRPRERMAMRTASTVLANSAVTVQKFFQANSEFRDLHINLCPLGIASCAGTVAEPFLKPGRFALIVGRLVGESRYKGHDILLDLWPAVREQFPDFKLVIAGDGPDRRRLEEKAAALGLLDAVTFTGLLSDEKLERLYRDCEFFVMPSMAEGFGLVYLEAMRAGKACLAAPGAAAAVIEDGKSGIIADPTRRDELLQALFYFMGHPQRTAEMGRAGYERFRNTFTAEHFGESLMVALRLNDQGVAKCAE
jgi:glycosyltransferase involved in cell wall biosynthesis